MKRLGWEAAALGLWLSACSGGKTSSSPDAVGGQMSGGGGTSGSGGAGASSTGGASVPIAGSNAYSGGGNSNGNNGNGGATTTPPEQPNPANDSGCSDGVCSSVWQGSVADVALDHGFWEASVTIADGQRYFAVDGELGKDGFLFATTSYDGSTQSRRLAGGVFRLPSREDGGDRSWFCIDAGEANVLSEGLTRLDIGKISRLAAPTDVPPGDESLTTTLTFEDGESSPLDDDGSVSRISAYSGEGGTEFYQLLLPVGDAAFVAPWRVLGFVDFSRRGRVEDLVLLRYGSAPAQLSFPAQGSTLVEDGETITLDLRDISEPVACPGTPVDGTLSIYVNSKLE